MYMLTGEKWIALKSALQRKEIHNSEVLQLNLKSFYEPPESFNSIKHT